MGREIPSRKQKQTQMLLDLLIDDNPEADVWSSFDPPYDNDTVGSLVELDLIRVNEDGEFQLTDLARKFLLDN